MQEKFPTITSMSPKKKGSSLGVISMCSLNAFLPPPPRGHVTLCEVDGHLTSGPTSSQENSFYPNKIPTYPSFSVLRDLHSQCSAKDSVQTAFLPGNENVWKRAINAWCEQGFLSALEEITGDNTIRTARLLRRALTYFHWIQNLHGSFYPHLMLSNEETIEEFSSTAEWKQGKIRAFAWHPHIIKFAVALHNDSVKIVNADSRLNPILKYRQQKGVCDMAWRPLSASTLAIACLSGIAVWNIDPTSVVTRPSSACVQWLTRPGHCPVTAVQWDPRGKFLLSSSPRDSAMIIWDVATLTNVPLRCVRGGGVSLIRWSPDGQRVFAATPTKTFRVWEAQTWTYDWWSTGSGRCRAACWSPEGDILLTSIQDEPFIYSVTFSSVLAGSGDLVGGAKTAIPVINLTPVFVQTGDEYVSIGGSVQSMVWDKTGKRLAVCFSNKDGRQEFIAVFCTRTKPTLDISPCGFIRGLPGDKPQHLAFQNGFEGGALLTVCWSSGEISHIPFLFPMSSPSKIHAPPMGQNFQDFCASPRILYTLSSPVNSS